MSRDLEPSDWHRFDRYAPLVIHLTIPDFCPAEETLRAMIIYRQSQLLPSLCSLSIRHLSPNTSPFVVAFLPSNLTTISISRFAIENDATPLTNLLNNIFQNCTSLKGILLDVQSRALPTHTDQLAQTIDRSLKAMRAVESLQIRGVPLLGGNLRNIAGLPNLKTLSLAGRWITPTPIVDPSQHTKIISLSQLVLAVQPRLSVQIIYHISPPTLHRLIVNFIGYIFLPVELEHFAQTIASELQQLEVLDISIPHISGSRWSDLSPLLSCQQLTEFSLDLRTSEMELDGESLADMAKSWSQLRAIRIRTPRPFPALVAYRALERMAQYCSALHTIQLHFQPSSFPPKPILHWSDSISTLDVTSSYIRSSQVRAVARYISGVMPMAVVVVDKSNSSRKIWGALNHTLALLREIRMEERARMAS